MLAQMLVAKYGDHLPLHRQSQIFEREGINLDRSTLADWVGKATALLEPLADAIERHVLGGPAQGLPIDLGHVSLLTLAPQLQVPLRG